MVVMSKAVYMEVEEACIFSPLSLSYVNLASFSNNLEQANQAKGDRQIAWTNVKTDKLIKSVVLSSAIFFFFWGGGVGS